MRRPNTCPSHTCVGDLRAAGFIVAEEKSVWQPIQVLVWLGLKGDAKAGTISITDRRISKALGLLNTATSTRNMSARQLARIGGSVISTRAVFVFTLSNYSRGCSRLGYKACIRRLLSFGNTVLVA